MREIIQKGWHKGNPFNQKWSLSPLFHYLGRFRGKGKGGGLRGFQEVNGERVVARR